MWFYYLNTLHRNTKQIVISIYPTTEEYHGLPSTHYILAQEPM